MSESYSVKAVLSAVDKGFTSTIKNAQSAIGGLKSSIKSGLGMGVMMGIGQQAFSSIASSAKGLWQETMKTSDAMQKLEQAMTFDGGNPEEIKKTIKGLKDYADKTVFDLKDVSSTFGALSANGIKDSDTLTKALGNSVAVYGGSAREFSSVGLAFSQAMSAGALHAQDWNQILNASPQLAGGLRRELMKLNPAIGEDFKEAMKDGAITSDLLAQAVKNIGLTEFAKDASRSTKTFEGAMGNMKASVENGMLGIYETFAKSKIVDGINTMNINIDKGFAWLEDKIPKVIQTISPYWKAFTSEATRVGKAFGKASGAIFKSVGKISNSKDTLKSFKDIVGLVGDALVKFAKFCEDNADKIGKLITNLPKLWIAFKGFKILSSVCPLVALFGKGILGLAGKGIGGIAEKLLGISRSQKEVGNSSVVSGGQMLTSAKSFALMGLAVLGVALGFGILALASIALANNGGLAIGVMVGMVGALVGLGFGMAMLLKTLAPMSAQLMPVAMAMLALGGAVLLVALGFGVLALASIALANAGGLAIGVMFGLVLALAGLMALGAYLAPMLAVGTSGFLAFGAMILMCGVGALFASMALVLLTTALPTLVQYGLQGAMALMMLGLGLTVFAVGATLAGVACLVLAVGLALVGASVLLVATGFLLLGTGLLLVATGALLSATALTMIGTALPPIAQNGLQASVAILALGGALLAFGVSALTASIGVGAFGIAMTVSAVGVIAMGVALKGVNSSMKSIAKNAKATQKSLNSMQKSIKVVETGLNALGSKAKSAMQALVSAFDNTATKAMASGIKVGNGFTNGMQVGLVRAPLTARTCLNTTITVLLSGYSRVYSAGAYISQGFARGMRSQLGAVRKIAQQLAIEADKAVRAKAKIHSPSRVSMKLGYYWVQGFVKSIVDGTKAVWNATKDMIQIPNNASNNMRLAYVGELSEDYSYFRNSEYTIVVKSEIDGKEVARTTAKYTEDELNKRQRRSDRKKGKV